MKGFNSKNDCILDSEVKLNRFDCPFYFIY